MFGFIVTEGEEKQLSWIIRSQANKFPMESWVKYILVVENFIHHIVFNINDKPIADF
jgi:hypothetical protein